MNLKELKLSLRRHSLSSLSQCELDLKKKEEGLNNFERKKERKKETKKDGLKKKRE